MLSTLAPPTPVPVDRLRDAWVQQRLVEAFVGNAGLTLYWSLVVIAVLVAMLFRHVDTQALVTWAAAITVTISARQWSVARYKNSAHASPEARLQTFTLVSSWLWPLSGVIWGSLTLVFSPAAPANLEFVCMTVLLALPGIGVATFAAHWRAFAGYADGLIVTMIAALVFRSRGLNDFPAELGFYGVLLLAVCYWAVVRTSGHRMHAIQRANLELQFDNEALVASLTKTTRAALDAVAVKDRFIAGAAHDLRQPVHALALYASWLVAEPALVADIAPKIVRSTRAVDALFNSLFEFTGIENGLSQRSLGSVDLVAVIGDLELQYAPVAVERKLQLRTRTKPARAHTDAVLLKRLVGNLISNALKNTSHGGVLLTCRERGGRCCIEVWDTGVGIAEQHREAIFQEFYRIPHAGTEEGFGLGLAIVARQIELLGHSISFASRVGRGSVFRVEMERARERAEADPEGALKASRESGPGGWPGSGF